MSKEEFYEDGPPPDQSGEKKLADDPERLTDFNEMLKKYNQTKDREKANEQ